MEIDLGTLLTIFYCVIDDLYRTSFAALKPLRPGPEPSFSDSEVITVTLLAQWQGDRSERGFVRYVRKHWRRFFPKMLSQSRFNRRARDLCGVISALGPQVSQQVVEQFGLQPAYNVMDCVPVPLMRRCRGIHARLFANQVGIGHGGSDDEWYYGVQLLAVVNAPGLITGFMVGPANTEERWLAEALLRWRREPRAVVPRAGALAPVLGPTHKAGGQRLGPTGPLASWLSVGQCSAEPYLADAGFEGKAWVRHWWEHYQAMVLTKADYEKLLPAERRLENHWLSSLRQVIETVNGCLVGVLGLKFPRARTYWGLLTRLGAKVAAFNLALYLNQQFRRPTFSLINPITLD